MLAIMTIAVAAAIAPPTVAVAPPAPPPLPSMLRTIVVPAPPEEPRTLVFQVTVRRDSRTLWSGMLRMANTDGASYSQQTEQTVACVAATGQSRAMPARFAERLRVGLRASGYPRDRLRVEVEWQRLADPDAAPAAMCAAIGTRTVSINGEIPQAFTRPVTLNGDASLQVEIVPR